MQVVILCGGKGMRAYPYTDHVPKPMLPVCGKPILIHLMEIYAEQGHREFILSLGYRKEVVVDYFRGRSREWKVQCVDTGEKADTAERIARCADLLGDTFFATYADGLADIDLARLLECHQSHDGVATLTTVPLPSSYGTVEITQADRVVDFQEKPVIRDHWINAGFFVLEPSVFDRIEGDATVFEREPLEGLAREGQLTAYRHDGFWQPMDTLRDKTQLDSLWRSGRAPWKVWA